MKLWDDAPFDHLIWLSYDADSPAVAVIFDPEEAVALHEAGKTLIPYTPFGTSVSPQRAAPWADVEDEPHDAGDPGDETSS